jgi:hypothetical protein
MSSLSVASAPPLLVRDVMTVGVPVCREAEACGAVRARLQAQSAEVVVALDDDGIACGWVDLARLAAANPSQPVSAVMDEDIPEIPPDIPALAAAQILRDRGARFLFLMHNWPGEPRPSAVVSLQAIEKRIPPQPGGP